MASDSSVVDDQGPDPIDIAVGRRIRVRRKNLGISQNVLAEHLGVSFQQVQKYEKGANRVSASMLVRIAGRLETTVGWLVGETGEQHSDEELGLLAVPGALELLKAYKALSKRLRTALLTFCRSLAQDFNDDE